MTFKEAETILEDAAAKLGEHFDAVQIMASWPAGEGKGTVCSKRGIGNWYARQGMAHDFIQSAAARENAAEIAAAIKPEEQQ